MLQLVPFTTFLPHIPGLPMHKASHPLCRPTHLVCLHVPVHPPLSPRSACLHPPCDFIPAKSTGLSSPNSFTIVSTGRDHWDHSRWKKIHRLEQVASILSFKFLPYSNVFQMSQTFVPPPSHASWTFSSKEGSFQNTKQALSS